MAMSPGSAGASRARTTLYSGAGAAIAALAVVALLSRREGHSAIRPINATSHVLWGADAATVDKIDGKHTFPGLAINIGSAFFWGAVFTVVAPRSSRQTAAAMIGRGFITFFSPPSSTMGWFRDFCGLAGNSPCGHHLSRWRSHLWAQGLERVD